ncbi:hypothetical protein HYALB_00011891 [Hymenoscyphus albidus]|uniref:Uncharacterized protein n=1 Tax=Hymenoscyphus albidus TaxID=595503 RepID=A0A9N9Q9I8_9HELO|nr:hypothetical protein HYALB_00011891 [Hymenoscyphus albidus]
MFLKQPVVLASTCISILLSGCVEAVAITSPSSFSYSVARNASSTISSSSTNVPTNTTTITYTRPNSTISSSSLITPSPTHKNTTSTASQTGWYAFANKTANAGTPTPEPAILSPAIPPGLDRHDPIVLQPNTSVSLFYQSPAPTNASDVAVASVDIPKMAYPAVVLDHSALVTHVDCDPNNLRMKFLHSNGLEAAKAHWSNMPKFVMMSFHDKCGQASQTGERDYLLVHELEFNHEDLTAAAKISHIGMVEAVGEQNPVTVDMGTYTPASVDGNVGFDSANAPSVASNTTAKSNTTSSASDFDVELDDAIGYTGLSNSTIHKRFAGLEPHQKLVVRGWFKKIFKKVVNAVKKVVTKFIPSWTLTPLNKNIDLNIGGGNVATPWGKKGYKLYSKSSGSNYLTLYCVDCGVSGVVNVKATVTFNLIGIISGGSFSANGNIGAGLGIGVDANYAASIPAFNQPLVAIPLSPFAIPGLITIGPHLDLAVGANAFVSAKGQIYAGVHIGWPAIHAELKLFGAPEASGWTPSVTHDFQATGSLTLGADAYVTVSLGFGVSLLNGLKNYGVALVDKPDIYIKGASGDPACAHGLQITAGIKNEVYADILGSHHSIATWNGPSAGKCISIKKRDDVLTLPAPEPMSRRRSISRRDGSAMQIQTPEHDIGIHYADNGNLYALAHGNGSLVDMSTVSFATNNGSIFTEDARGRVFHGYQDTLDNLGISRFRLSLPSHIPRTAVQMTLQAANLEDETDVLVALDASHNVYYPIICTFGQADFPKLFLVKDLEAGVVKLMDEANVDSITGVKPEECDFVPLIAV